MACGISLILNDVLDKISFDILTTINITNNVIFDYIILVFAMFVPITFVHEALHGIAYKTFGGKIKFGFKGIYIYTQEISGVAILRDEFLIVLMFPVLIISTVAIVINTDISILIFALNLVGSTGDLLMAFYLCKGNENSYVVDREYGFDIIEKEIF